MDTRAERFNRLVGDVMRSEIRMSGRSVRQAAVDLDMDRSTLTRYLDGSRHVPVSVVYAVAVLTHVPAERIIKLARIRLDESSTVSPYDMPTSDIGWGEGELASNVTPGNFSGVGGEMEDDDVLAAASESDNTRPDDRTDEDFLG